jgi:hypothetical protein
VSSSFDANRDSLDGEIGEYMVRGGGCCGTLAASLLKRFTIYRRDYCGLFCQVISPLILVIFGLLLTQGPVNITRSPDRPLSTDAYPF